MCQEDDGIREDQESRGLGDGYKRYPILFLKQKTANGDRRSLVGSEMCIKERSTSYLFYARICRNPPPPKSHDSTVFR